MHTSLIACFPEHSTHYIKTVLQHQRQKQVQRGEEILKNHCKLKPTSSQTPGTYTNESGSSDRSFAYGVLQRLITTGHH